MLPEAENPSLYFLQIIQRHCHGEPTRWVVVQLLARMPRPTPDIVRAPRVELEKGKPFGRKSEVASFATPIPSHRYCRRASSPSSSPGRRPQILTLKVLD